MNRNIIILFILIYQIISDQTQTKIIDMHLHSYLQNNISEEHIDNYSTK